MFGATKKFAVVAAICAALSVAPSSFALDRDAGDPVRGGDDPVHRVLVRAIHAIKHFFHLTPLDEIDPPRP